jgi:hypothetical protein
VKLQSATWLARGVLALAVGGALIGAVLAYNGGGGSGPGPSASAPPTQTPVPENVWFGCR